MGASAGPTRDLSGLGRGRGGYSGWRSRSRSPRAPATAPVLNYSVRVLGRAHRDLVEIRDYLGSDSPEAAELVEKLLSASEKLEQLPRWGAVPRDARLKGPGFRFRAVGSYLIFYKILRKQVRVYRVLHGRRAYEDIL